MSSGRSCHTVTVLGLLIFFQKKGLSFFVALLTFTMGPIRGALGGGGGGGGGDRRESELGSD